MDCERQIATWNGLVDSIIAASQDVDIQFVWANTEIDGETIIVSHPKIATPIAARYAWADNPLCNLYNSRASSQFSPTSINGLAVLRNTISVAPPSSSFFNPDLPYAPRAMS